MKPTNTTRKDHDFAGLPTRRIIANFLRWKLLPFGFLERGPGIIWLASIWFRHRFGRTLATLKIKHHKWFNRIVFVISRLRHHLSNRQPS